MAAAARSSQLTRAALAFRVAHGAIAVVMLAAIGHVWRCAIGGRRDRLLDAASVLLVGEGVVVALNDGDCPLGPLQDRAGDPVPLFELVLRDRRAARAAVPVLGAIAGAGIVLAYGRSATARH